MDEKERNRFEGDKAGIHEDSMHSISSEVGVKE